MANPLQYFWVAGLCVKNAWLLPAEYRRQPERGYFVKLFPQDCNVALAVLQLSG